MTGSTSLCYNLELKHLLHNPLRCADVYDIFNVNKGRNENVFPLKTKKVQVKNQSLFSFTQVRLCATAIV